MCGIKSFFWSFFLVTYSLRTSDLFSFFRMNMKRFSLPWNLVGPCPVNLWLYPRNLESVQFCLGYLSCRRQQDSFQSCAWKVERSETVVLSSVIGEDSLTGRVHRVVFSPTLLRMTWCRKRVSVCECVVSNRTAVLVHCSFVGYPPVLFTITKDASTHATLGVVAFSELVFNPCPYEEEQRWPWTSAPEGTR